MVVNMSKTSSNVLSNMFTPRSFQVELLECALKQNTIACVNTEAGKRFLSTMLIRELMINAENDDENCSKNIKFAVLLLNQESLVKSQGELLQDHVNAKVKFCLKDSCSHYSEQDWKNVFESYHVLTISPELLLVAFETNSFLSEMIDLIIFDECQMVCQDDHPYCKVMQTIDNHEGSPNILGLTMSLLSESVSAENLQIQIDKMETRLHSTAQTATDLIALDRHSLMTPTENIILSTDTHKFEDDNISDLGSEIQVILEHSLDWLKSCQIHSDVCVEVIDWEIESLALANHTNFNFKSSRTAVENASGDSSSALKAQKIMPVAREDVCATPKALLHEVLVVLDVLGPWCVYKLVELIIKQLHKVLLGIERRLKQAMFDNNDEEPASGPLIWQKMLLQYVNTKLQMVFALCFRYMGSQKVVDLNFVSPKVHRLLQVLKEYKPASTNEAQQQSSKFSDRNDYVSWWQDSDAEDEDEGEPMEEKKKSDSGTPSPFLNTLCGIVFVEEKYVAMMLHRLLREISKDDKELSHVNSANLGSSTDSMQSGLDSAAVDKSKQEEVLRKFRCHETNLLISTSTLEDCAHIPKCNLVVRFDAPRSYRAYAQSKSRARASTSAYVMLIRDSEKCEFMEKLQEYKRIEQVLQGPIYQDDDTNGDGVDDVDEDYNDVIPPFSPSNGTAAASMSNAIKIINRYCSRLPSDPFTHLTPRCDVIEEPGGGYYDDESLYHCVLQLPINSHLRKPIEGKPMLSVKLAQQAVALEACKKLYECGELDDNLMPIGKETVKYAEELYPWKPEQSTVLGRPGSTKRRQTYNKDIPRSLTNCLPTPKKPVFIYEVELRMKTPLPDELNARKRKTYFPEDTSRGFGVVTSKPIPMIPGTPIFTRSGEETARLRLCKSYIMLSEQQIKLIKSFHNYIFSDMLRVDRVPLFFKPEAAANQLLIVALNTDRGAQTNGQKYIDIDWNFMVKTDLTRRVAEKMKKDPWYNHRMTEKKKVFKYERKVYEDAVVIRNYGSNDQPNRYYVAEIKDHLNPASPFPSSDYKNYKHYYEAKYGVDIRCTEQPLLDVDHTPSRLNLLTPRHATRKGKGSREKKSKQKNPVIFVPELCDVHPVPASLWRKAVCLPSVLYRVGQLLIGEELRKDIALKSGIVAERPPLGHVWPDIEFVYPPEEDLIPSFDSDLPPTTIQLIDDEEQSTPEVVQEVVENILETVEKNDLTNDDVISAGCIPKDSAILQNHSESSTSNDKAMQSLEKSTSLPSDSSQINGGTSDSSQASLDLSPPRCSSMDNKQSSPNSIDSVPNSSSTKQECRDSEEEFFSDDYQASFLSDEELELFNERRRKKKKMPREKSHNFPTLSLDKSDITQSPESSGVSSSLIGPGPEIVLQALTLSNASDGYNLERMEMLGDSFLKHAVTLYLYCTYPDAHEGKLSYMRSKKVSNYNLYRIGRGFGVAGKMTAHIFDPIVNWMPAGFTIGSADHIQQLSDDEVEIGVWTGVSGEKKNQNASASNSNRQNASASSSAPQSSQQYEEDEEEMYDEDEIRMIDGMLGGCLHRLGGNVRVAGREKKGNNGMMGIDFASVLSGHASMHFTDKAALKQSAVLNRSSDDFVIDTWTPLDSAGKPLSSNDPLVLELHTQHSLSDKSIADSVEALLGAYLTACGHRVAQLLLCHLGLQVLPKIESAANSKQTLNCFGHLVAPPNYFIMPPSSQKNIKDLLQHLKSFERKINYEFKNKAYLLQAFTHASYYYNNATDCYQRLEFLGDAVLDFLITRHLCADERHHSPGALTDLRCALVNNTIFASLAVRYDFHKYFRAISPELQLVIEEFVVYQQRQEEAQGMDAQLMRDYGSSEELDQSYMEGEEEEDEMEDVEVPKALGDIFESIAGAVFMDSGMDLDAVWNVYSAMMLPLIEKFSSCVPRSPVRELLEMEPETAKFSCAEKRFDGKIRVTVEIIGKGRFKGVGRSYRIAKSAAARRALRFLKRNFC